MAVMADNWSRRTFPSSAGVWKSSLPAEFLAVGLPNQRPYAVTRLRGQQEPGRGSVSLYQEDEEPVERRKRAEAVLFLAKTPLTTRKLAQMAHLADGTEARTMIRQLNEIYEELGRALRIEQIAGGYRLLTREFLSPWLSKLGHLPPLERLSPPMMETLSVVAYRQPVSRADVESVRGVSCGELLRQLMERDLIRVAGRSEELGRPYLYGTTKRFLQLFGLPNITALPPIEWQTLQEEQPDPTNQDLTSPKKESSVSSTVAATSINPTLENKEAIAEDIVDDTRTDAQDVSPQASEDEDEEVELDEEFDDEDDWDEDGEDFDDEDEEDEDDFDDEDDWDEEDAEEGDDEEDWDDDDDWEEVDDSDDDDDLDDEELGEDFDEDEEDWDEVEEDEDEEDEEVGEDDEDWEEDDDEEEAEEDDEEDWE